MGEGGPPKLLKIQNRLVKIFGHEKAAYLRKRLSVQQALGARLRASVGIFHGLVQGLPGRPRLPKA